MSKLRRKELKPISWQDALKKPWKVYDPNETSAYFPKDLSIITTDGREVVGSSDWMRADRQIFNHIVELHNQWLATQQSDPAA